ncbi:hypothetical protein V8G54_024350 [Vigna mungo]|uniref:Uncharacterized protein n=1 Tax=Vigna mungo TaxID=3915 RepID=A0AAQ3RT44_VIGMU
METVVGLWQGVAICRKGLAPPLAPPPAPHRIIAERRTSVVVSASKSLNWLQKSCKSCGGKGAVECPGCKGTGKNKKNGNMFERWKCFDCQGFGLRTCPSCGKGRGLTPEQRGER